MSILPVPEIVIDTEPETEEAEKLERKFPETWRPEPAWWQAAWQVRVLDETRPLFTPDIEDSTDLILFGGETMTTVIRDASEDTSYNTRLVLYQMRLYDYIEEFKPAWMSSPQPDVSRIDEPRCASVRRVSVGGDLHSRP
jgi:hypothetical protein